MSKKDLLERISRDGGGSSSRGGAAPRSGESEGSKATTTKRVSRRVVRRRPANAKAEAAPEAPRRRVVETAPQALEAEPDFAPEEVQAAPEPEVHEAVETAPAAESVEAAPVPESVEAAAPEAPAPEPIEAAAAEAPPAPEPVEAASAPEPVAEAAPAPEAVEAAPAPEAPVEVAPAPEPVVEAAPAAEAAPEPVKAEPAPAPEAAPEPVAAKATPAPESAPAAKAEKPAEAPKPAPTRPDEPKFAGLGAAVVKPPPGYDPTNPTAWRRRMEAENEANRAKAEKAAAATTGRRRRVAGGETFARRENRRGAGPAGGRGAGRQTRVPGDMMRRRRRGRKGAGGSSTVAMKAEKRKVRVDNVISVGQLAHEMGLKATMVIRELMQMGMMVTVNQMLDFETASLVAAEFEYEAENVGFQEDKILQHVDFGEDEGNQEPRPPVITVMGHVDHGKTTLLDAIRNARVAQGEAGGITQHIGAYQVERDGNMMTFLDTPGHAAFTAMRARGAEVTDIVVLVVAADDGLQPQTVEAINHAKAADVPIIVAVNKMDKAGVSAESVMQELTQHGLVPEEWGGETQIIPISALRGDGIDDLLEAIQLQSEVLELTANPDRPAEGIVIEAKVERGRGPVASVLIQQGTLKRGDTIVLGSAFGRVRAMVDHKGDRIKEAGPSMPVELFGISDLPSVGDVATVVKSEKDARAVADHRAEAKRQEQFAKQTRATAEDLFNLAAEGDKQVLYLVLKGDVQGSVEALKGALEAIDIQGTELRMLHSGVGNITESDVSLVTANEGLLIGFNVRLDANGRRSADEHGVNVELYSVIYDVLDRVEGAMKGMVAPEYEAVDRGEAEVRLVIPVSRVGMVAGCYVLDGKIGRNDRVRVLRDGEELWDGPIGSLKRFKDDVREVSAGYECGLSLDGFNDIKEGDILKVYTMQQVKVA